MNTSTKSPAATLPTKVPWLRRGKVIIALASGLGIAAIITYAALQLKQTETSNVLHVCGRIEEPSTYITAAIASRVKFVAVREGDVVHKGQLIISLDAQVIQDKLRETESGIANAERARKQAGLQVKSVEDDIKKAKAHVGGAQKQAMLQVEAAQSDISKAQSASKGFWAHVFSTKKKKEEKTAQLRNEMTQAQMQAHEVQGSIAQTTAMLREEMTQAQIQKFQAQAMIGKAKAAQKELSSNLSFFNITSPIDGICAVRSVQPGELASKGRIMLTLSNPQYAYLRGFIPEGSMGRVRIGQPAQVFLDSFGKRPFAAKVTSIDKVASFTPENVYFKSDRTRQVFGVNISIDHPGGFAKPGMPADAQIILASPNIPK